MQNPERVTFTLSRCSVVLYGPSVSATKAFCVPAVLACVPVNMEWTLPISVAKLLSKPSATMLAQACAAISASTWTHRLGVGLLLKASAIRHRSIVRGLDLAKQRHRDAVLCKLDDTQNALLQTLLGLRSSARLLTVRHHGGRSGG